MLGLKIETDRTALGSKNLESVRLRKHSRNTDLRMLDGLQDPLNAAGCVEGPHVKARTTSLKLLPLPAGIILSSSILIAARGAAHNMAHQRKAPEKPPGVIISGKTNHPKEKVQHIANVSQDNLQRCHLSIFGSYWS